MYNCRQNDNTDISVVVCVRLLRKGGGRGEPEGGNRVTQRAGGHLEVYWISLQRNGSDDCHNAQVNRRAESGDRREGGK